MSFEGGCPFAVLTPRCFRARVILHVEILCPILVYTSYHTLGVFLCSNSNKEKVSIILSFMRIVQTGITRMIGSPLLKMSDLFPN